MPPRCDTLTPMERQLLHQVHKLAQTQERRLAAQDRRIAELEATVADREDAIGALTDMLVLLLGPMDRDGSSPI